MRPKLTSYYLTSALLSAFVLSHPNHNYRPCPPLPPGRITIQAYQLYPENLSWDANLCQAYISILYNSSIGIYSPATSQLSVLPIPSQTLNPTYHIAGVIWDKHSSLVSAVVTQALAFRTGGVNITGDNWLNKYDPAAGRWLWSANLTTVSGGRYGGFNDVAHDRAGNSWVCGTFPGTILKVDKTGRHITEWYVPRQVNRMVWGFTGIEVVGRALLVVDVAKGALLRFEDIRKEKGGEPVRVPVEPVPTIVRSDAMRLPDKYGGKVLLITDQSRGVLVLRSRDKWKTAEYLGLVPNDATLPPGALTAAVSQMANRIYMVPNWFGEPRVEGTLTGNRTTFYLVDITEQVDELLSK
ncbi:Trichothecene biosynthesis protein [Madurella fahalii]|uniref:Trichothecene biosynthesis protein n=1 Tax=Madurella fahalii TaxID=1157608 RepID=A0ABQ0GE83_9PEZI